MADGSVRFVSETIENMHAAGVRLFVEVGPRGGLTGFVSDALGDRRLFVARRDGRIEAFIVCNPCLGGTMWAVETYRRRADATRGVVDGNRALAAGRAVGLTWPWAAIRLLSPSPPSPATPPKAWT